MKQTNISSHGKARHNDPFLVQTNNFRNADFNGGLIDLRSVYFTMAHLSLCVGADDLQIPGRHEEMVHLLWGGLVKQCGQEHPQMEFQGTRSTTAHTTKPRNHRAMARKEKEKKGEINK